MIYFICVLYYILTLVGIVMRWRFRRFSAADFKYNKSLNRKRIFWLLYSWGIVIFSIFIIHEIRQGSLEHPIIFSPAVIFLIIYIFIIGFFEAPFRSKKYKKKKPFR